ncbi:1,2-dihydroxy-3-keto-5-methylthiopentene dioxygenase [Saccharothrix tamanrassetensis]|uniref:Acireductone dioxygenase n=1 Tax=Saccharothrix tamanrassetensis TaxID=1051531 RepID=A0A841CJ84_9PSEU|nr:cupin [Saccharothrix tamanrassetensis]MBB5957511.1 1,2-dihydroxy-3-keto-5-methylthiopentene dioxygenase [Saccharothrix tamanrassetensis]
MTLLTVWPDTEPGTVVVRTADPVEIADELKQLGVRYEQWPVIPGVTRENALEAYRAQVDRVTEAEGYVMVDAMEMTPSDDPAWLESAGAARRKFLAEHTHDDDEDRFFARGAGVFYLHVEDRVHAVLCEAGDLLSVPKNTTHWFDMGTRPDYVSIRFFHDDDGWVGNFTGSEIAKSFPTFDTLMAGR